MPQELNVLCCYSCKMYQVRIVKKAPKWNCTLCNAKQSVQQVYFRGSGQDCRLRVQQLNAMKANDTYFIPSEQDAISDAYDTFADISQESNSDETIENRGTKYFELSETEAFEDTEDLIFNKEADNTTPDDAGTKNEDINNKPEEFGAMQFNCNSSINDKCDTQNNNISIIDNINASDIFETYDELDEPLDL